MEIPKPSDADKAYFRSLVPDDPRVVAKPMFGNIAAFVAAGLSAGKLDKDNAALGQKGLRVPAEEQDTGYCRLTSSIHGTDVKQQAGERPDF